MREKYQIKESKKYYGKYIVVDTEKGEEYEFHNLQSARDFIKKKRMAKDEE